MTIGRRGPYGPGRDYGQVVRLRRSAGLLRLDDTFGVSLYQLAPDYVREGVGWGHPQQAQEAFARDKTLFADRGACKLVARYSVPAQAENYFGHRFEGGQTYDTTQQCEHLLVKMRGEHGDRYGHKYVLITSGARTRGFEIYELGGLEDPILEAMYAVTGPGDPGAMFGVSENFVYSLAPDRPGPLRVRRTREMERRIFGIQTVDAAQLVEAYMTLVPGMERHQGRFGGCEAAREYMARARADPTGDDYALALALRVESIPGLKRVTAEAKDFAKLSPLPHGFSYSPDRFFFDDRGGGKGDWFELVSEASVSDTDEHLNDVAQLHVTTSELSMKQSLSDASTLSTRSSE